MVAIVTGQGAGLERSSASIVGGRGQAGSRGYYDHGDGTVTPTDPPSVGELKSTHSHDLMGRLTRQDRLAPGGVIWWAGDEIDRFPDFSEFFEAMVNYNAQIAQRLGEGV